MDETQASGAGTPTVESLQAQLEEERRKAESFYGSWQRSAADFANFKRRTEQERSEAAKMAGAMAIMKLLPAVDDLERALASLPKDLAGLTWVDGIGLIYRKMMGALESEGVQPIEALNQRFDPQLHEAVMSGPGEENVVVAELQRGYTLHGAVIRPAMVKVGNGENPAAGE